MIDTSANIHPENQVLTSTADARKLMFCISIGW
jgi:hypothetical protein